MAKCRIKKYDKLPARVGWIDVDYLRWRLWRHNHPSALVNIPIIGWLSLPNISKQQVIKTLDDAIKIHNERKTSRIHKPKNYKVRKR